MASENEEIQPDLARFGEENRCFDDILVSATHSPPTEHLRHSDRRKRLWATHQDTLTVLCSLSKSIARKRNFVSAEVVFQRVHTSITLEIWKHSARQIRACWPSRPSPLWILTLSLCLEPVGHPSFLGFAGLSCAAVLCSPGLCWLCPLAAVSSAPSPAWHMSRSEQLRKLAAQLASLATLERRRRPWRPGPLGGATGGRGAALRRGSRPTQRAPAFPLALALTSPEGCSQSSSWLQLAPAAPPDGSASSHRCSGSSASAAGFVEPGSAANALRAATPSVPRDGAVDLSASAA